MMPPPLVTIITPSLNQGRFLPDTLRSVRNQDHPAIEHIVVDGRSTDGSVDTLHAAPGIRWISEPDRGPVDALNKGFALATGDFLGWLNADDTFHSDTVSAAVRAFADSGADVVYGDLEMVDEPGTRVFKMCWGIPFDLRVLLVSETKDIVAASDAADARWFDVLSAETKQMIDTSAQRLLRKGLHALRRF